MAYAWPLVQGTAAATVAWAIALQLGGGHKPFFAPIAAFVALNAPLGERGLNTLRLVAGVFVGIGAGELTLLVFGTGYAELAVATLGATVVARMFSDTRIVIAQAAVGAILTVALADGDAGLYRMADALIGAGVALVFTQLLFSPEPLALLRRAESAALADLADALALTTRALEHDDEALDAHAVNAMRDLRDRLGELGRVRRVSERVARRSAVWRWQRVPVVQERENADQLDLLAGSCLMLTRVAVAADTDARRRLAPITGALAGAIGDVAGEPGDRAARQRLADRALAVARRLTVEGVGAHATLAAPVTVGRVVAVDVMAFAGVDQGEAIAAVREEGGDS
jgi:uncharacterized membrane protein YgaE (UPF0421/DUF939 family)